MGGGVEQNVKMEKIHSQVAATVDGVGNSAKSQYCDILNAMIEGKTAESYDMMCDLSQTLKLNKLNAGSVPEQAMMDSSNEQVEAQRILRAQQLSGMEKSGDVSCTFPKYNHEASMFKQAGVGLSKEEHYEVKSALTKLAHSQPMESVRFWGKIHGVNADYWIAEVGFAGIGVKEDGFEGDARGRGANKYTYFYVQNLLDDWTQLHDVVPARLAKSRAFNKMLTGNPDATLRAWPSTADEMKEKHLLRCLIARISSATVIAPDGQFEPNGEEGFEGCICCAEEPATKTLDEMADIGSWVHHRNFILNNGGSKYNELGEDATEVETELLNLLMEAYGGAVKEPLGAIGEDVSKEGEEAEEGNHPVWSVSVHGDPCVYEFGDSSKKYGVAHVQSKMWPGAHACFQESLGHANVYIGNGLKAGQAPFNPAVPQAFQGECDDAPARSEPYPTDGANSDVGDNASENAEEE